MMNKSKEIIEKLGSAISNPSQPDALKNKMRILTHHRNYPCF
ncbi:Uncharacterised protein [Staphylococcus piscifermentans]|nr:Uncharacterised protein [Staphylococcus piscifermentans]